MRPNSFAISMGYLLVVAIATMAYSLIPWWTVDDAFISYRYGKNLLEAGELTWNVGERPWVEGYTGIFLPMLSAALLGLGLPLVGTVKVLGILAAALGLFSMDRGMRDLGVGAPARVTALLLMACCPLLYEHSISGLETIFYMAAIGLSFWGMAGCSQPRQPMRGPVIMGLGLLWAGLCRPEGLALAVFGATYLIWRWRQQPQAESKKALLIVLALAIVPLAGYWTWRSIVYGAPFPNTYYAKAYDGFLNPESAWALAKSGGYYLGIPTLIALLMRAPAKNAFARGFWACMGAFVAACILAYLHSNLWMNYGSRFFFPLLPIALAWLATRVQPSLDAAIVRGRWRLWALAMLAALQLCVMAFRFRQEWAFLGYYHWIVQDELIPVGMHLQATLPPGSKVISYMDAGAMAYYSGMHVIDFGRLNDRFLARGNPSQPELIDYFFAADADAVVMNSTSDARVEYIPEAMSICADPRFQRYQVARVWGNRAGYPYWQWLFLRKPQ